MIRLQRLVARQFKQLDRVDLELPERARILVKGLNEAGKSTLFEAVFFGLFGQPLGGQGTRSLDDLIRYGAESAQVDLTVGLSAGRALEIRRQLRRGKPNIWELDILGGDGGLEEQIRGNREVNLRVTQELGFDAESLLNTCFVEQKKLDKLEGMNRAEREQSLMKLLNLDHLLAVAEGLKVRLTDRQTLARLTDRRDLARAQEEQPLAAARVARLEAEVARMEALDALQTARAQREGLRTLDAEISVARRLEAELTEQAAQAKSLAEAQTALEQAGQTARQAAEAAAAAARARELAERCRLARDVEMPAVTARGLALRRLARRRDWLGRAEARAEELRQATARRDTELDALAADLEALNQTRRAWVEARAAAREAHDALGGLEQDRRAFEVRAALGDWLAAGAQGEEDPGSVAAADGIRQERRRLEARQTGLRWGIPAAVAVAAVGLVGARMGLSGVMATALTVIGLLALGLLILVLVMGQQRSGALALQLGRLEGEAAARERDSALRQAAIVAAEARLRSAQAVCPASLERGRMAMVEIEGRLAGRDREGVQAELTATQTRLIRAQEATERLGAREAELRAATAGRDGAALGRERDLWAARSARLASALPDRRAKIEALADGLDLGGAGIDEELGALRARLAELRRLAGELGAAEAEAAVQAGRAAELGQHLNQAWVRAGQVGAAPPTDDPRWAKAQGELAEAYERAGGDGVRARLQAAARHGAELTGSRRAAGQSLASGLRQLSGLIRAAGGDPGLLGAWSRPAATGEALQDAAALAAADTALTAVGEALAASPGEAPDLDRARLAADLEQAHGRRQVLRHEIQRLAGELGLAGVVLDLAETEAELAVAARDLALRERAARMVEQAGRRVMQGVLPSTLLHMQRILPALTEQRYLEARLTDDLQIEVYDERAGNWRKKNIFSGGAKDQFSLALRLAFAMATLPEERGSAPSFLFLDEPLGAFDPRRAEALIELLTTGEVARAFDQIFLISHVPVDERRFDRTVALEAGRVVSTDLTGGDLLGAEPDEV